MNKVDMYSKKVNHEVCFFSPSFSRRDSDAIRHVTGGIKVARRQLVKMEIRTEKFEKKALAFSACRLFIVNAKSPFKVGKFRYQVDIKVE